MDAISDVSRGSEIFSSVPVFPPLPQPLNLDDLFGFSETARKKYNVEETVQTKYFVPSRIFINQVDTFTGKYVVSVLSDKDNKISTQRVHEDDIDDQDESNIHDKENNNTHQTNQSNIEKSSKPKKNNKEETTINEVKEQGKRGSKKCYTQKAGEISNLSLEETIEDLDGRFEREECPFDTSKLTVAEYYEMMELESVESRKEFLNDKLGKFLDSSDKPGTNQNELELFMQDKSIVYEQQTSGFEIIGTLKNCSLEEVSIDGVTEIIQTGYDDPEFLKQLVTCGTIIYIVNENLEQTEEATWALNSIINFINNMKNPQDLTTICTPVFLLVSSFMTWSLTKPLSLNEPELPFIEKDYRKRKPHPNYESLFELEEQLIKAQSDRIIKSAIIVSGIPYGHEENELRYLFDIASCYKHLPIYYPGNNFVPTIHIENLGHVIKQTLSKLDGFTTPFIFAKDPSQNTMADISKAVSLTFGTGFCELQHKEFAFINDMVSQDLYNKITTNIILESSYPLFKEEEIQWKYESGFAENINHIVREFVEAEKIKPLRIILYGVSLSNQVKNIAQKLSKCCHIPYVNPTSLVYEYCDEVLVKKAKVEEQKLSGTLELRNLGFVRDTEPPAELILCDDEKSLVNDFEVLTKLQIHTCDEAKLLPEKEKGNIIARRLKKIPYVYHGYVLEEYPHNLAQANAIFLSNDTEMFHDNSSILPDFVIFFNELEDSSDLETSKTSILDSHQQELEEYGYEASVVPDNFQDAEYGEDEEVNIFTDLESSIENLNTVVDSNILPFFSNLNKCLTVTLDFRKSESEEEIFTKTLNVINRSCCSYGQSILESSRVIEHPCYKKTTTEEEKLLKDMTKNTKPEDGTENKNEEGLRKDEEIILAIRSYPLLTYLINFISPTLTNGILEMTTQIPQDPIDYLAEYIFKNNPDGRMMPQDELKLIELSRKQKKNALEIDSKACLA